MEFDSVSQKRINELEQLTTQLLKTMRNAKLQHEPIYASLQEFEQKLGEERRIRFDKTNSQYNGY
jgi:DNA gyrase/topoisomerase IV subunit A